MKFKISVTLLALCLFATPGHTQDRTAAEYVETYGKAQEILEGRSPEDRAASYLRMGKIAFRNKFYPQALDYFQKAKGLNVDNLETHIAFVHFEFVRGNYHRASQILIAALDRHPEWAKIENDPASFFKTYGEFQKHFQLLTHYAEKSANNKDVNFLVGFYKFSMGHTVEAVTFSKEKGLDEVENIKPLVSEMKTRIALTNVSQPVVQTAVIQTVPTLAELSSATVGSDHFERVSYRPSDSLNKNLQVWGSTIDAIANKYDVDPRLVAAVIHNESRFNPLAVSHANARGMMQLIPGTARRFGVERIHDPIDNIEGGVRYLRYLLSLFKDVRLSVAAYNAGELNVIRYGGVPPFNETQDYVRKVLATYRTLQ